MSSFSWLDFSEHDRRRALEVIEKFRERDTVDELGIGTIRDAFADLFFPGTSVIHSRARYFFFIPWMYLRLEGKRVPSEKIAGDARRAELALVEVLLTSGDGEGTIGRRARSKLKILPSAIYWQALQRLGIRLFPGSRDQYHRSIDRFYANAARAVRTDDGDLTSRFRTRNWHARLPKAPDDFPQMAVMTLTAEEAPFLREQIVLNGPNSFYRHLVEDTEVAEHADFPWAYSRIEQLSPLVQEQLRHAQNFSEVLHGAPLVYNLILAKLLGDAELVADYREQLQLWRRECNTRGDALSRWDRQRFWEIVTSGGAHVPLHTRVFVERWLDIALMGDTRSIADSRDVLQLIAQRERQLKRGQARVDNQRARELWTGASGTRRMSFRWEIALQGARDIHEGLEAGAAHA